MAKKIHCGEFIKRLEAEGKTPGEIHAAIKADPDYYPKHRDAAGNPLTYEAAIVDYMKAGMNERQAVSAAGTYHKGFQQDYYRRLALGMASSLETVVAGKAQL
jgi:hypothetical protein